MSELKGDLAKKAAIPSGESTQPAPKLTGKLIEKMRQGEHSESELLDRASFEAKMKKAGTEFKSSDFIYTVVSFHEGKNFVHTTMQRRDGSGSASTNNLGVDRLWNYYEEGKIEF